MLAGLLSPAEINSRYSSNSQFLATSLFPLVGRFVISQRKFIEILRTNSFYPTGQQVGSHQTWEGTINGRKHSVTVDVKYDEYCGDVLASMIRQSGLPKKTFRQY